MPTRSTNFSTNAIAQPVGINSETSKTFEETTTQSVQSPEFDYISGNVEQIVSIKPMTVNPDGRYQFIPPSGLPQNNRVSCGYFTQPSTTIDLTYSIPYDRCVFEAKEYLDDYGWFGYILDLNIGPLAPPTSFFRGGTFDQRMDVSNQGLPASKSVDGNEARYVTFTYTDFRTDDLRSYAESFSMAGIRVEFYNSETVSYGNWNISTGDLVDLTDVLGGRRDTQLSLRSDATPGRAGAYGTGNASFDQTATDVTTIVHSDVTNIPLDSVNSPTIRCTRWGGSFTKGEYKRS
jgi:hypothetical protein